MKAESARQIKDLVELEKFNPETLRSDESWMWMRAPSANENPAKPVLCSPHCWLAGRGMLLEEPAWPVLRRFQIRLRMNRLWYW